MYASQNMPSSTLAGFARWREAMGEYLHATRNGARLLDLATGNGFVYFSRHLGWPCADQRDSFFDFIALPLLQLQRVSRANLHTLPTNPTLQCSHHNLALQNMVGVILPTHLSAQSDRSTSDTFWQRGTARADGKNILVTGGE